MRTPMNVAAQTQICQDDIVTSPLLSAISGINHGFGTMYRPLPRFAIGSWPERPLKRQVHGLRIAVADHEKQDAGEADGWFTRKPGLLLTVVNADCLPVLMARHDGAAIAALHIGWRGALHDMAAQIASLLRDEHESFDDWRVAIGPGARACCYEVSRELIRDFIDRRCFPEALVEPRYRHLNLPGIVAQRFDELGFRHVSVVEECTLCSAVDTNGTPKFFSYRRDGSTDVQVSAIQRKVGVEPR